MWWRNIWPKKLEGRVFVVASSSSVQPIVVQKSEQQEHEQQLSSHAVRKQRDVMVLSSLSPSGSVQGLGPGNASPHFRRVFHLSTLSLETLSQTCLYAGLIGNPRSCQVDNQYSASQPEEVNTQLSRFDRFGAFRSAIPIVAFSHWLSDSVYSNNCCKYKLSWKNRQLPQHVLEDTTRKSKVVVPPCL